MKKHVAIALGLVIAGGGVTAAQAGIGLNSGADINIGVQAETSLKQQFKTLDSDGDGVITRQEAKANARLKSDFDSLDDNGDDRLTRSEFKTGLKAESQGTADTTGSVIGNAAASVKSGVVTGTHKTADAAGTAATKTKKGIKTGAEKTGDFAAKAANKTKAGMKAGADAVGNAAATAEVTLSSKASEHFDHLDANDDGVISDQEAKVDAGIASSFDKADEDDNGQLTKAEFETALDISAGNSAE